MPASISVSLNNWEDDALVLSRTFYSETSLILKVFSKHYGVRKGLVKGGKKINASYIFESGNLVNANWRGRNEEVLGNFRCELIKSNSALFLNDSLKFSALVAALNLIEYSLLENAIEKKIIDKNIILESLTAFKRAGANAIISYYADRLDKILD